MADTEIKSEAENKQVKIIPLTEIDNARIRALNLMRQYYKNKPPFPVLDVEDPEKEKPRAAIGFVKDVCKKRSSFLFGAGKFPGPMGIDFIDATFQKVIQQVWDSNRLEGKILTFGGDMYWAGYAAWKVIIQPLHERRKIRIDRIKPQNLSVIFGPNEDRTKENVQAWVIMYERADNTWYREELYKDKILYYDGKLANSEEVKAYLGVTEENVDIAAIKFSLKSTEPHKLGIIPIVFLARESEDSIFGTMLPETVIDRIDRINEMYTNALFATAKIADPVLWLKGVKDVSQLQKDSDSVWFLENPEAALGVLEWTGVPESTLALIRKLSAQIYKECDLPAILLDAESNIADIPSRSLKILYTDLEGAIEQDRSLVSDMLYDLFEIIFAALKSTEGFNNKLKFGKDFNFEQINWGTIIPVDEIAEQQHILTLYNGRLLDTLNALMKMGYSKEKAAEIIAAMKKEDEEKFAGGGNNYALYSDEAEEIPEGEIPEGELPGEGETDDEEPE
jgi:hypothetical protein